MLPCFVPNWYGCLLIGPRPSDEHERSASQGASGSVARVSSHALFEMGVATALSRDKSVDLGDAGAARSTAEPSRFEFQI